MAMSLKLFDDISNAELGREIDSSQPSDVISINSALESKNLLDSVQLNNGIPSDLFFKGTISLLDFVLRFKIDYSADDVISCRLIVFQNYKAELYGAKKSETFIVGAVVIPLKHEPYVGEKVEHSLLAVPMVVQEGSEFVAYSQCIGYAGMSKKNIYRYLNKTLDVVDLVDVSNYAMEYWYAIQTALLNPPILERVRRNSKNDHDCAVNSLNHSKNSKVAYLKYINVSDLIGGDSRKYERHTHKWNVIGHFRQYASGKKIWIDPYEKGTERNLDSTHRDIRERKIILDVSQS